MQEVKRQKMENLSKNRKNILIVDDTEANIDILVETLDDDYEISVAMDGETALENVYENTPDLILLDIMMPGIDGYEVCRRLKADEKTKNIPIIFITALSQVEDETKGLKLGAVDYVTKPISPPIVKARVENHLELQQARKDLEKQNHILQENIHLREEMDRISRHDLKTPLNSIISIPRIILQDRCRLEPEHIKLLEMVEKSGHAMLSMINLSLDLFKMEKGTYKLQPVALNILSIISKIILDLRSITDAKAVKFNVLINELTKNIRVASDSDLFGVLGEELLCYSMFANIIKNAVEASPYNGIITICLSNLSKSLNSSDSSRLLEKNIQTEQAQITINNQGVVPASIRENFFDKYVTSGKKSGTGLGTYSAKLMAQTLGGDILMSTNEADGTTITIILKYDLVEHSLASQLLSPITSFQFPNIKVMVVDDDEYNRFIIENYLNKYKISVESADNGQSAFNKFKEHRFDMIFMDMEMPVMDGIESVTLMRQWQSDRKTVIVALSGHDDLNTYQNCLDSGFDEYLSKPISSKQLAQTILKFFCNNNFDNDAIVVNTNTENFNTKTNAAVVNNSTQDFSIKSYKSSVDIDADLEDLIPSFLIAKKTEIEKISELLKKYKALNENDYEKIKQLGHKLKGGFNMYGFKQQGLIGSVIEDAAKQQDFRAIQNNVNLLKSSLKDIQIRYVSVI